MKIKLIAFTEKGVITGTFSSWWDVKDQLEHLTKMGIKDYTIEVKEGWTN